MTGRNQGKKIELTAKELRQIETLAGAQCTIAEICATLEISEESWRRRLRDEYGLDEIVERGRELGKASLRRLQWRAANRGRLGMLIWLGKQYLGQRDVRAVSLDTPPENPGGLTLQITRYESEEVLETEDAGAELEERDELEAELPEDDLEPESGADLSELE